MKHTAKMKRLLERMAAIDRMDRGKLCQMPGRPYYNHQTWRNGHNEVRYITKPDVSALKKGDWHLLIYLIYNVFMEQFNP